MVNMRIAFEIKAIQASFQKYFDEAHADINRMIEAEITPAKINLALKSAVERELSYLASNAIRKVVEDSVKKNEKLAEAVKKKISKIKV